MKYDRHKKVTGANGQNFVTRYRNEAAVLHQSQLNEVDVEQHEKKQRP